MIEWKRLPLAAIISFAVAGLINTVKHGWQGLLPVIGVISFSKDFPIASFIIPIAMGVLALLVAFAYLAYRYFGYALVPGEIRVRQGVINRRQLLLPFERVQSVKARQPFYLRPFNLVILDVESAGSKGSEISLPGLPEQDAQDIRRDIMAFKDNKKVEREETTQIEDTGEPLIKLSLNDLIRHGFVSRQAFLIIGAIIGFGGGLFDQWGPVFDFIEAYIEDILGALGLFTGIIIGILSLICLIIIGLLVSILITVIRFYGFTLRSAGDVYHIKHGLIERHERNLPLSKIQSFKVQQSITGRWVKRAVGKIIQAGQGTGEGDFNVRKKAELLPGLDRDSLQRFQKDLYPDFEPKSIRLRSVLKGYAYFLIGIWTAIFIIPTFGNLLAGNNWGMLFLAIPALLAPLCFKEQRNRQYGLSADYGLVTGGLFTRWRLVFPLYKVQNIALSQNPIQRRKGTATLTIALAGERITIPYMPLETARAWQDYILYKVESSDQRWM